MNWIIAGNFILSILLYLAGFVLARKYFYGWRRWILLVGAIIATMPVVFALLSYVRVLSPLPYYQWRVSAWTDLYPAFAAFPLGTLTARLETLWQQRVELAAILPQTSMVSWPWLLAGLCGSFLMITGVHYQHIFSPLPLSTLRDTWKDGVCLQSSPATCGPCSAATILRWWGENITEKELAKRAYSTTSGTRNWYLVRALQRMNWDVQMLASPSLQEVKKPAIVGVWLPSGTGHFLVLLPTKRPGYLLSVDPLFGRQMLSLQAWKKRYRFDHFAITIRRSKR